MGVKFHRRAWSDLVKRIVDTDGVDRMGRVADACNANLPEQGYFVSVEGDDVLTRRDYSATVITATGAAIRDNAERQTLITNMHLAG